MRWDAPKPSASPASECAVGGHVAAVHDAHAASKARVRIVNGVAAVAADAASLAAPCAATAPGRAGLKGERRRSKGVGFESKGVGFESKGAGSARRDGIETEG